MSCATKVEPAFGREARPSQTGGGSRRDAGATRRGHFGPALGKVL